MGFSNILFDVTEGMATITINRPDKLNALNRATLDELNEVLKKIEQNAEIKSIIITGSGEKAFVAGADIAEIAKLNEKSGEEFSLYGQAILNRIENNTRPVLAAVNGFALGGGCELALACHIRIASENAKFGQPEVSLGVIPGFGGTQRLPRLVGKGKGLELCLTGNIIDAQEAYRIGLVNAVVPMNQLKSAAENMLRIIMLKGPIAVAKVIESINKGLDRDLRDALQLEAKFFAGTCATEDKQEGTKAFLEKRTANFSGK